MLTWGRGEWGKLSHLLHFASLWTVPMTVTMDTGSHYYSEIMFSRTTFWRDEKCDPYKAKCFK